MAARKNPSAGSKPDKILRDALMLELNQDTEDALGKTHKKFRVIAANLVRAGLDNKLDAIKEIWDRVEGKATQPLQHTDPSGGNPFAPLMELIAANGRPRPGSHR